MDVIISSGGMGHTYRWAQGIQRAGYLKHIITTLDFKHIDGLDPRKVKRIFFPELLGHILWRLPGANSLYFAYWVRDNLYDLLSRRYIDGGDVLHVLNHFGLHAIRRARSVGMKIVVERGSAHPVTVHQILVDEYRRYGMQFPWANERLIPKHVQEYEETDLIAIPSQFVWHTMVEMGVSEAKLRYVPPGVAIERFQVLPELKQDDIFRVIFAGAISLQKGVQYLLEAFKRLALPDSELVLVGGIFPDSRTFLPAYKGLYRHIPFTPQEQLVRLYNESSVFVLPSIQDGFGMVVYEAGACGLPAITTQNVGAEIRDGVDGFVVPIRDPDAIADRLLELYHDRGRCRQMGQSARELALRFTWDNSIQRLLKVYEELAP